MGERVNPAVVEGNSLLVDFNVTLGYDDYAERDLTMVRWECQLCDDRGFASGDFAALKNHARRHVEATPHGGHTDKAGKR